MDKYRPTEKGMLVTVCCPLDGPVPEALMSTKSVRKWHSHFLSLPQNKYLIGTLNRAINASVSKEFQSICPIASNKGWSVELTLKFYHIYDGIYFINTLTNKSIIKKIVVSVCCSLRSWLPSFCKSISVADIRDAVSSLKSISVSEEDKLQLDIVQRVLTIAIASSANPKLQEIVCIATNEKGVVIFSFEFNDIINVLSFIPMFRHI